MIKSTFIICFVLFAVRSWSSCINVEPQEPVEIEFEYEDGGAFPTVSPTQSLDNTENTPVKVEAINQISSVINNDGSFKFTTIGGDGVFIEIEGSLKDENGTKTLVLEGKYEFKDVSWWFSANGEGFSLKEPPISLSNKVVASLLGR